MNEQQVGGHQQPTRKERHYRIANRIRMNGAATAARLRMKPADFDYRQNRVGWRELSGQKLVPLSMRCGDAFDVGDLDPLNAARMEDTYLEKDVEELLGLREAAAENAAAFDGRYLEEDGSYRLNMEAVSTAWGCNYVTRLSIIKKEGLVPQKRTNPVTGRKEKTLTEEEVRRVKEKRNPAEREELVREGDSYNPYIHRTKTLELVNRDNYTVSCWERGCVHRGGKTLHVHRERSRNRTGPADCWDCKEHVLEIKAAIDRLAALRANRKLSPNARRKNFPLPADGMLDSREVGIVHGLDERTLNRLEAEKKIEHELRPSSRRRGVQVKKWSHAKLLAIKEGAVSFNGVREDPDGVKRYTIAQAVKYFSFLPLKTADRMLRVFIQRHCPALPQQGYKLPAEEVRSPATGYPDYTVREDHLRELQDAIKEAVALGEQRDRWKDMREVADYYDCPKPRQRIIINEILLELRRARSPIVRRALRKSENKGLWKWVWVHDIFEFDKLVQEGLLPGTENEMLADQTPPPNGEPGSPGRRCSEKVEEVQEACYHAYREVLAGTKKLKTAHREIQQRFRKRAPKEPGHLRLYAKRYAEKRVLPL